MPFFCFSRKESQSSSSSSQGSTDNGSEEFRQAGRSDAGVLRRDQTSDSSSTHQPYLETFRFGCQMVPFCITGVNSHNPLGFKEGTTNWKVLVDLFSQCNHFYFSCNWTNLDHLQTICTPGALFVAGQFCEKGWPRVLWARRMKPHSRLVTTTFSLKNWVCKW